MPKSIVFFHPDLGIGGAERLVIDAAVGLQNRGYKVTIFTSHCDPTHCFDEASNGTLDVRVRGNTIVPPSILGRFAILCAILRQLHLIFHISLLTSELQQLQPQYFFVDQLSAGVPLLRIIYPSARILFYCHFPDKLLAKKGSWIKSAYRIPFDWLENWSTGCTDGIVVNSKFTKGVFDEAFPLLKNRDPKVVYPCVDTSEFSESTKGNVYFKGEKLILSINRFERKKDIGLAIKAYAALPTKIQNGSRLILAGGYDHRVLENVEYHKDLCALADSLGLKNATSKSIVTALAIPSDVKVLFLLSVPNAVKTTLLQSAHLLIYTPRNEHLGIVPLEAMLAGVPVLAADEGGPRETVVDGQTGWLRNVKEVDQWTKVIKDVLDGSVSDSTMQKMGQQGCHRVKSLFSKEKMAERLDEELKALTSTPRPPLTALFLLIAILGMLSGILTIWLIRHK